MRSLIRKSLSYFILAFLSAALACCGEKDAEPAPELLSLIPAQTTLAIQADLDALLKMAGCQSAQGAIQLTPQLEKCLNREFGPSICAIINAAGRAGRYAFLKDAYLFLAPESGQLIVLAPLKEPQHEKMLCLKENGVTVSSHESALWVTPENLDPLKIIEQADSASLSESVLFLHALSRQGIAKGMLNLPVAIPNPIGDNIDALTFALTTYDRSIALKVQGAFDGKDADPFAKLKPVDKYTLPAMPTISTLVACAGLTGEGIKALSALYRPKNIVESLALQASLGCIPDDGGTFSVQFAPGGSAETISNLSLDNWIFKASMTTRGENPAISELIESRFPEFVVDWRDSTLVLANFETDDDIEEESPWEPIEPGCLAWAQLNIPYRSETMKAAGLSNGYRARIEARDSTLSFSLNILGNAQYLIPALINDLTK